MRLAFLLALAAAQRQIINFDRDWKFNLGNPDQADDALCPASQWTNFSGFYCEQWAHQAAYQLTLDECRLYCCSNPKCAGYSYGPGGFCVIGEDPSMCVKNPAKLFVGETRKVPAAIPQPPANGPHTAAYDDSTWQDINVPHDFIVTTKPGPEWEQNHGFRPKNVSWYRKHFTLPKFPQGTQIVLEFDGVYRNSDLWLNGQWLGHHDSGYVNFDFRLDNLAFFKPTDENVLAVRVDPRANEGWWYEGGGIYRHVRVIVVNPLHTKQYGIYIPSSVIGPIVNLTADAMVDVYTELENVGPDNEFIVQSIIFDPKGAEVSRTESPLSFLPTGKSTTVYQNAYLTKAALWDITSPSLYVLQTLVHDDDGTILDERKTTFGIRKAVYDAQDGFSLNDVPIKVKGMCNHQDFAGIGTAIPESIQEFRVRRLQDLGVNAWRMSHNPPNPELLDLTDSLGMMVWDENRFLGNFSTWVADLATMVLRDRNHPSIMWWSLCNEWGCEQLSNDITVRTGIMFREVLKRLDLTRPISGAWTGDMTTGYKWATTVTDIMGINYNYGAFPTFHQAYPTIPLISSESCSCTSDRSYLIDANQSLIGAYHAWSCIRDCWAPIATNKYIQGSFDWTGFDYRGEETPTPWPAINSHFGILDLAGFMKDDAFYYQAQYRPEPLAHITPSYWNKEDGMTNATTAAISQCVDPAPAPGTELPPSFQNFKYTFDGSGKAGSTIESLYKPGMCVTFNGFNQYPSPFVECNAADTNQLLFWDPSLHHFYVVDAKTQTKYCLDANGDGSGNVGFWTCSDPQHANQNFVWDAAKSRFALNDPDFPGTCLSFVDHSVAQVWVYTNGDSVELFLNGTSLGIMNVSQFEKATYFVHYSPGNLTAVASKSGVRWASDEVLTAGPPSFLELEVERHFSGTLKADGVDALLLTLSVKDANGVLVRHEAPEISFKIDGPGALIGLGNGNPSDHEDDKGTSRQTFSGLLRAVIQSGTKPGPIVVTASADCCSPATITLQSQ